MTDRIESNDNKSILIVVARFTKLAYDITISTWILPQYHYYISNVLAIITNILWAQYWIGIAPG